MSKPWNNYDCQLLLATLNSTSKVIKRISTLLRKRSYAYIRTTPNSTVVIMCPLTIVNTAAKQE